MKRIVICLDGTWNQVMNPATVTNVVKIAQAVCPVASDGTPQVVYYNAGVGTGDLVDRILGGFFGRGLRNNVKRAYAFLSLNYAPGDEIYIFGFSRGAYTARALAGIIGACGILQKEHFEQFEIAWNFYREAPKNRQEVTRHNAREAASTPDGKPASVQEYTKMATQNRFHTAARIRCVGVWDTVGSYGIPSGFGIAALGRGLTTWMRGFHNTLFGDAIDIGLHAVAIDEKRRPFAPTFWTIKNGDTLHNNVYVEQVWFAGAHSNIGGGYPDAGLSDLAFRWMIARVTAIGRDHFGSALEFDKTIVKTHSQPSSHGMLYRSEKKWPISRTWPYRRPLLAAAAINVRAILWNNEKPDETHINERLHWSVIDRLNRGGLVDGKGQGPVKYQVHLYKSQNDDIPKEKIAEHTREEDDLV